MTVAYTAYTYNWKIVIARKNQYGSIFIISEKTGQLRSLFLPPDEQTIVTHTHDSHFFAPIMNLEPMTVGAKQ